MQPRSYISPEEYLALEAVSETKHEYWDGALVAMAGASMEHNLVKDNLAFALKQRLQTKGCRIVTSDQRVQVDARYYYPDVVVVCDPPQFNDTRPPSLLNPNLLVEVSSESTVDADRLDKLIAYTRISSLQEYWIVNPDKALIIQYTQQEGKWVFHAVLGLEATLKSDHFVVEIPLKEIYALVL